MSSSKLGDLSYQLFSYSNFVLTKLFALMQLTNQRRRLSMETNAAGEALPPFYIFDSGAKLSENFQVKVEWLVGLQTVSG